MSKPWDQPKSTPVDNAEKHQMKEKLFAWYDMQARLKELKAKELKARKEIFNYYFPKPHEGTNDFELEDGYILKGKYSLTRIIEDAKFRACLDDIRTNGITPETMVDYKPSLMKKNYNRLETVDREYFDQFLIIKPSIPSLEVIMPAKNKNEG